MARISIQQVAKKYGEGAHAHQALAGVSMDIADGEFVALLGPSGSGKTSLLRAIAGLEQIDAGVIEIDGERVSGPGLHVMPENRHVAVVFQNHALWPHMTVFQNVMFPLLVHAKRSAALDTRVQEALASVELEALQQRFPDQLSGGQKQRVALARAMVGQPRAILFDEPLASLDVELRRGMLRHIARARSAKTAVVYVTHNQEEALALADRVAVLNEGRIEQLQTPMVLSQEPASRMVATFVGGRNILPARVVKVLGPQQVWVAVNGYEFVARCQQLPASANVWVSIQPSAFEAIESGPGLHVRADYVFFQGDSYAMEGCCTADPETLLNIRLPLSQKPELNAVKTLGVTDAWVLPGDRV